MNKCVNNKYRHEKDKHVGRRVGHNYERVENIRQAKHAYLEWIGYIGLGGLHVLAETVYDAADRCRLEKVHRAAQDRVEQLVVQIGGALDEHDHLKIVGYGQQDAFSIQQIQIFI